MHREASYTRLARSPWIWGALITAAALALRLYDLPHIFLWTDETGFGYGPGYFNEHIYGRPPMPLYDFAWKLNKQDPLSTNTWGWPAVVWITCRIFGGTLTIARIPGVLIDTVFVLLVFLLAYRMIPEVSQSARVAVASGAAIFAAISMPQMEFSQRVIPYVSASCMAAAILLGHMKLWRLVYTPGKLMPGLRKAVAFYTAAVCVALSMHPSLSFLFAVSALILTITALRGFSRRTPEERRGLLRPASVAAPVIGLFALLNAKGVHSGYHAVLSPYYHRIELASIPKLIFNAYDLAAYHLNLFYNPSLYLPDMANPVLIPLALICLLGWIVAAMGKLGKRAVHFARLGAVMFTLVALLSVGRLHVFPFGGTRQTLFLSPFIFVFTAFGAWATTRNRFARLVALGAGLFYAGMWTINLPRFYHDRLESYTTADLVKAWNENGRMPLFVNHFSWCEIRYALRDHPEIPFLSPASPPPPSMSYLMMSTHAPLGDNYWLPAMQEWYAETRQKVTLVVERPAAHPQTEACLIGCLYNPPSGLWIYKAEPSVWDGANAVSYHALFQKYNKYF